jgi:hypothetical protein
VRGQDLIWISISGPYGTVFTVSGSGSSLLLCTDPIRIRAKIVHYIICKQNYNLNIFLITNYHIGLLKPLQKTFRLFKNENENEFWPAWSRIRIPDLMTRLSLVRIRNTVGESWTNVVEYLRSDRDGYGDGGPGLHQRSLPGRTINGGDVSQNKG